MLESPIIQLPPLANTATLTMSLIWARALTGASGNATGARIELRTLTNYSEKVLEIPMGGASDWSTISATLPYYFADIPVRIQIIFTTGDVRRWPRHYHPRPTARHSRHAHAQRRQLHPHVA